ncbi:thiamine biosynthesis protein ThiC [Mesorhizobium sp. B2-8-3]|nr:phosphomethylpyrimidine synthase ThiC [Mesorhizobium sp. B2-8-3]TPJ27154.1 thiamine biosynthesis protein ThiC [Mesorhizobium sp. B2-8-3]
MAALARIPGPNGTVVVGDTEPVRVMALVGTTSRRDEGLESEKIFRLAAHPHRPDIVADLSIRPSPKPLWRRIVETGLPAATLPIYTAPSVSDRLDRKALLDRAVEQMEGGVGMITVHPTATKAIVAIARQDRGLPWTSRGGGLIIRDLLAGTSAENAYLAILPDLISLAKRLGVTISIGATFRSATVLDADDRAQRMELRMQADLAAQLLAEGCSVVIEGPGHAAPGAIRSLARQMRQAGCPVMPLGPIPTDLAVGYDHVSAAIGATLLGLEGAAHILAAVTREEHTGGVPSIASTLEAIDTARVAAHVINLQRLGAGSEEKAVARARSENRTCVAGRTQHGCSRCGHACPL